MQDRIVRGVVAVAVVLLAVAAVMASYQYKREVSSMYPNRVFSVEGTGEVDTTPDLATFSATVLTDGGTNVAEVQAANTEKMNRIDAYLKEQGVAKDDLKTAQYSLSPRYSYAPCLDRNCPPPTITGYNLTQTLEVKVREASKLGDLLSGVVTNGANSVSEVRFVVDDDSTAKDEARQEAMADAKKKAKALAKAGGFRLGKLVTLYENSSPMPYGGYAMAGDMAMKSEAAAQPVIEPGSQTSKVQMTLTFEIK